jgi:hypothetical protein
MGAAVVYVVFAVVIGAFLWSQLRVIRSRRYTRARQNLDPPQTTTAAERPLRAIPDERPTIKER